MRKSEVADVFVKKGCEEGLPTDEDSTVRLTLVDFDKAPVSHEMADDTERLAHIHQLKDNGNAWFKRGDFQRAKRRYESAVYFGEYGTARKSSSALQSRSTRSRVSLGGRVRVWASQRAAAPRSRDATALTRREVWGTRRVDGVEGSTTQS